MKIKRTFAPTMREALNIVKLEQGDDAVILGNNKVAGGVEIISAIDYDQAQINAELTAQQRQAKREQHTPPVSANTHKPTTRLESVPASSPTMVDSETSMLNRQEPVFGDISEGSNTTRAKPISAERYMSNQQTQQKPAFDWQSSSPKMASVKPQIIKPEVTQKSDGQFDAKEHAEDLLSSIKNLQSQLTESQAKDEKVELPKSPETQFKAQEATEDSMQRQAAPVLSDELLHPALDEMKQEMRNMRQLMQSQLTALEWDKYKQRHPVRSVLLNLLTELGIGADICERVINQIQINNEDPQLMWRQAIGILAKLMPQNDSKILDHGGVVALVGSTGVGKTTTIAKIAARFAHIHGKRSVALISTDNFRIGAQEQLQQYAKLLQIPLLTANTSEELSDRLGMLTDKKLVLIDTAGVSQNDMRLSEQFHNLQIDSPQIQPLLVLSANTQLAALNQTIKNFEKVRLAGSIVTKLDESASLGGVITSSIRHHLPINFCGFGQQVPEDLEVAKSHRIISKAVSLMQQYKETPNAETMAMRFNKIVSFGQ